MIEAKVTVGQDDVAALMCVHQISPPSLQLLDIQTSSQLTGLFPARNPLVDVFCLRDSSAYTLSRSTHSAFQIDSALNF